MENHFEIEERDSRITLDYKFIYEAREEKLTITKSCLGRVSDNISKYPELTKIDLSSFKDPILFIIVSNKK